MSEKIIGFGLGVLAVLGIGYALLFFEVYAINYVATAVGHSEIHVTVPLLFFGWVIFAMVVQGVRALVAPRRTK
ncbi:MAG: hypothetical protein ACREM8_09780 [Vulcanimicrobiaceae bacterium]